MIHPIFTSRLKEKYRFQIPYGITFKEFIRIILWCILFEAVMIGACKLLIWLI